MESDSGSAVIQLAASRGSSGEYVRLTQLPHLHYGSYELNGRPCWSACENCAAGLWKAHFKNGTLCYHDNR